MCLCVLNVLLATQQHGSIKQSFEPAGLHKLIHCRFRPKYISVATCPSVCFTVRVL